jgi:hypothetical protein
MVDSVRKTTLLVIVIICINWIVHKQDWDGLVIVAVRIAPDPVNHDFVLFLDGFSYFMAPFMVGVS